MSLQSPRLLVATEFPPNASGGGPAVVRQMLKNWPVENLSWWSCFADSDNRFGQKVSGQFTAKIPSRFYPNQRMRGLKSWVMERVWNPWATRHFRRTVKALKPDVVWVIPHCWAIPPLFNSLPGCATAFHLSVHDYADTKSVIARFGESRACKMADMVNRLYATATTRDAICQPMLDDLKMKTGAEGSISRAGLERGDFDYLMSGKQSSHDVVRIAYAGTILVEDVFEQFVVALNRIRQRSKILLTMEFFGAHSYRSRKWFDASWMNERGNLAEPQLSNALRECSWGFAPMSLGDDDPRYNRFSLPTKLISYLAAGLPVIAVGHPESSLVKIEKAYDIGICITSGDPETLNAELSTTMAMKSPSEKFRAEILRCSRKEFDAERMRQKLYESFFICAGRTSTLNGTQ